VIDQTDKDQFHGNPFGRRLDKCFLIWWVLHVFFDATVDQNDDGLFETSDS
jgi:hypothetical protein